MGHAKESVPFYRERLAGFPCREGEPIAREAFDKLPVLARRDVQSREGELVSRTPPPSHGRIIEGITSGSTGTPVRYRTTDLAQFFGNAFAGREHLWHERDFAGGMVAIRALADAGCRC
jgi:phenylacetate-CoA ligase